MNIIYKKEKEKKEMNIKGMLYRGSDLSVRAS